MLVSPHRRERRVARIPIEVRGMAQDEHSRGGDLKERSDVELVRLLLAGNQDAWRSFLTVTTE